MVQFLLGSSRRNRLGAALAVVCLALLLVPVWASRKSKEQLAEPGPPDLLLEGGRKLVWERSFDSEYEVKPKRNFWNKLVDAVAGQPQFHTLVRPYSIVADSHGRIVVTDPGAAGVHIFDFAQQKYKFIERKSKNTDPMISPQCVALDAQDNIYVTDSDSGKIFVFDPNGQIPNARSAA